MSNSIFKAILRALKKPKIDEAMLDFAFNAVMIDGRVQCEVLVSTLGAITGTQLFFDQARALPEILRLEPGAAILIADVDSKGAAAVSVIGRVMQSFGVEVSSKTPPKIEDRGFTETPPELARRHFQKFSQFLESNGVAVEDRALRLAAVSGLAICTARDQLSPDLSLALTVEAMVHCAKSRPLIENI